MGRKLWHGRVKEGNTDPQIQLGTGTAKEKEENDEYEDEDGGDDMQIVDNLCIKLFSLAEMNG